MVGSGYALALGALGSPVISFLASKQGEFNNQICKVM